MLLGIKIDDQLTFKTRIEFSFLLGFSFTKIDNSQDSREGGGFNSSSNSFSLTPLYYFHPLHRLLDISWVTTAESPQLHIEYKCRVAKGKLCALQSLRHYLSSEKARLLGLLS